MDSEQASDSDPEPALYDHTVPKPKRAGLALLAGLLFLGGGQLVKGHFRRFFAIWGIMVAVLALIIVGGAVLFPPEPEARDWIPTVAVSAYGLLWFYQLWDAVTRP